ncbi:hypothetical protein KC19_4G185500 [Ceratodon purpureus]|uniref:Glycosyltransferase 2-like domain-containing protein n=1 Tax=Ceratodon purpureus TaxID=3225 RepID=A0A8T0ICH9_CERPU|nr:hypothetical protein KC19_4G185500 [Ceratodon purpureus]
MLPISRMPVATMRSSSADLKSLSDDSSFAISVKSMDSIDGDSPPAKGRPSLSPSSRPSLPMRLACVLTVLQFGCAVYATILLYWMSPTSVPDVTSDWAILDRPHPATHLAERVGLELLQVPKAAVCEMEEIPFQQKKSDNPKMIEIKTGLFREVMEFQQAKRGCETLDELMSMPSTGGNAKVTVILNHFQRKTLCAQLDALLEQTLPFHEVWVVAFGSPQRDTLRSIVQAYNDSRINIIESKYDYKYYGRFQLALQANGADFVYLLDDDMIPGRRVLQIMAHTAGTDKYRGSVLGSIGRILPLRQKDSSFPSYRKFGVKEAGLYLPDPAYDIVVDRIVKVDFLSSGWFLSAELVKSIFIETPPTFATGEDLHLSYSIQKYNGGSTYVVPVDPRDQETWADRDHRLAQVSETTVIHKDIVEVRDNQWWRTFARGYVTQWAEMNPQNTDAIFYAHSISDLKAMAPLLLKFRATPGRTAYLVVSGGKFCPCEEAADVLGWSHTVCSERRLNLFDLEVGSVHRSFSATPVIQEISAGMRGLIKMHSPSLVITVSDAPAPVLEALKLATSQAATNASLVQIPRTSFSHALWMATVPPASLPFWSKMRIQINIITQDRATSLLRLLQSLSNAHYVGDAIDISFNMDNAVDNQTLHIADEFHWPHGKKIVRRRIIRGGLIRAVSESWYPASDDDFGLLLEDDIEVSPFYYMWLKYALLQYHYNPDVKLPELNSIALYTPRIVEVVKERPRWNATEYFNDIHPNTPYLHQLPCSWGALFTPKKWREFYKYMGMRYTEDPKANPVQIPKSRTNGWQASWKKFLIDMMYLRGYVTLYPNFPNQTSFSTNHMEPGAHIAHSANKLAHDPQDFVVPLLQEDFLPMLPSGALPPATKLPVINLFNQAASLRGLKAAGAKLQQDVLQCEVTHVVVADDKTGEPLSCVEI